ncbi:hypothetical protein BS17DRAFT_636089, partial [Gyrodon lividus]
FNVGLTEPSSDDCVGAIMAGDVRESMIYFPFWVVGIVFLSNIYTAFDLANVLVGFACVA